MDTFWKRPNIEEFNFGFNEFNKQERKRKMDSWVVKKKVILLRRDLPAHIDPLLDPVDVRIG